MPEMTYRRRSVDEATLVSPIPDWFAANQQVLGTMDDPTEMVASEVVAAYSGRLGERHFALLWYHRVLPPNQGTSDVEPPVTHQVACRLVLARLASGQGA